MVAYIPNDYTVTMTGLDVKDDGEAMNRIEGHAGQIRRHGRGLLFVGLADSSSQLMFEVTQFRDGYPVANGLGDPFPSSKSALKSGDKFEAYTSHVNGYQVVRSWKRLSCGSGLRECPAASSMGGRRNGLAATSGWVACPLCPPSSPKRYNRRGGIEAHLEAIHSAYHCKSFSSEAGSRWAGILQEADNMGIYMTRVAVGSKRNNPVPVGDEVEPGTQPGAVQHPGLLAARDGDTTTLRKLLGQGWDPLGATSLDRNGASALDWAAGNGQLGCLELLLPTIGSRQVCRRDGRGPAHWAARCGQVAVLERLLGLETGVCFHANVPTGDGSTMLMLACFGGHVKAAEVLVMHGADLFKVNGWGCDAGHFASMGGHVETCKWLKERGILFSRPQCKGHTALHKAASRGNLEVLHWLLEEHGLTAEEIQTIRQPGSHLEPRANDCGTQGIWQTRSPTELAMQGGYSACVDFLRAHGF